MSLSKRLSTMTMVAATTLSMPQVGATQNLESGADKNLIIQQTNSPKSSENKTGFIKKLTNMCERVGRLTTTFDGHEISVPEKPLSAYPAQDKPIIIQINSMKTPIGGRAQFHARSSYDGIVINSDGIRSNAGNDNVINGRVLTSEVFVLSPQKMGIDPNVLKNEMITESQKTNDYNFFLNNCVDHVIRPLQQAGCKMNLGAISTPRELSEFCEQAVKSGQGIRISAAEYEKVLQNNKSTSCNSLLMAMKQGESR